MEFFQQLPHLEPYGNPQYFVYVIAATLPIFIGLFFKKRFAWYEVLVSLFLLSFTMLVGGKTNQLAALGIYLFWEILLLLFYKRYRKSKDGKLVFYLVSFLPSFRLSLSRCSRLSMGRSFRLVFWVFLT